VAPTYTCVETQTFYFFAKSGHIGSTQVIYNSLACACHGLSCYNGLTNIHSGLRTTTQFNTKVWYPDASKQPLWSSDPLYNHGFSDDRTAFHADNCSITLNESGDSYAIKSTTNTLSVVDLKVKRIAPGFVAGNTGVSHFGIDPENPWGSMWHKFWPRCEGEGGIMTKEGEVDFAGSRVLFIHALQGMKPHHAAARWNFVDFQGPDYSAVMMEFTTPPSYGSSTVNVGCIVKGSEILYAGCTNTAKHVEAKKDTENDWPEPSAVEFKWAGKAADGTELSAELIGSLGERLDKIDVMAEVPGFVKTFVGHAVG